MANPTHRDQVFFSYSRKDKKWLELFQTSLKPLSRANQFSVWDDTKIEAGDVWRDEIKRALASAKVAVLLVSRNFLSSDFIAENELPPLLEAAQNEGLKILLVIIGHSLFEETELGRYQAVNDPSRPLASISAANREKEIVRICKEIQAAVILMEPFSVGSANEGPNKSGPSWVTISYKELLDPDEIVRTGQKLTSVLSDNSMRGVVQPFVDRYSELLPAALEMFPGSGGAPHATVMDIFPSGESEPAWVALVRGGRIHVTTDGEKHVKVFLLGDNPKQAYTANYDIVRHCLGVLSLLAKDALQVDVFAYHNDYPTSELRLNCEPYSFTAASFETAENKSSLDLSGLAHFFAQGSELRYGTLKRDEGLFLTGVKAAKQTIAGEPVELSDLAVAYRAVFHAGDNHAFVSLDPARDPTKATVNFGGFLENTRLGTVVLEADKRFKTIISGLDPNSFLDVRNHTRKHVPAFLTSQERDFLKLDQSVRSVYRRISKFLGKAAPPPSDKWIWTRFWYYPDKIELHTDDDYESAAIIKARFTADAERSQRDFDSPEQFEKRKRDTLSPSHRENIAHLNLHYADYARAFPELKELGTVARLIGICVWLFKLQPSWLDCDELLSVELPACRTETERTRLIATTLLSYPKGEPLGPGQVIEGSQAVNLTPMLDKTVEDFFQSADGITRYLRGSHQLTEDENEKLNTEALRLFAVYKTDRVRNMLHTVEDVQLFASYAAKQVAADIKAQMAADESRITQQRYTVDELDTQLKQLKTQREGLESQRDELAERMSKDLHPSAQDIELHDRLIRERNQRNEEYNLLVKEYDKAKQKEQDLIAEYNKKVGRLSAPQSYKTHAEVISGGINLLPKDFSIQKNPSSPELITFNKLQQQARPEYTRATDGQFWVTSKGTTPPTGESAQRPNLRALAERAALIKRRKTSVGTGGSWKVEINRDEHRIREQFYDAEKRDLLIIEFASEGSQQGIIGQWDSSSRIAFRRL